jgi:hypothetical protein
LPDYPFRPGGFFFGRYNARNFHTGLKRLLDRLNPFDKNLFILRAFGAVIFEGFNNLELRVFRAY